MIAASDQTERLLLDLERRVGVEQEYSDKLETQLKVMLVLQSRGFFRNDFVARIARTLATCLSHRGDWVQAGQYAQMAANLERRPGGPRPPVEDSAVPAKLNHLDADSSVRRDRVAGTGTDQDSPGQTPGHRWSSGSWWSACLDLSRRTVERLGR